MQPHNERANGVDIAGASIIRDSGVAEAAHAAGKYHCVCRGPDGQIKWEETINNVVTTLGRNLALDTFLAGASYTAAAYLGLISNVSYGAGALAADTMASHAGWTEAGGTNAPTYSGARKAPSWSAAAGASKSGTATFTFTSGTNVIIKGCLLVFGPSASATIDDAGGTLYSAGTFTVGDKTVSNGDSLTVTYSALM